jgi:hypothetical protein
VNITTDSISGKPVIFESILEEVPGGASLEVVARLDYTDSKKKYLKAGAPVYVDLSTRIAKVCKSALGIDGGTSTNIRVGKYHHFLVGDFFNDGVTTGLISAIDKTGSTAYDTVTVNTALIYADGTKYGEGTVTGSSVALAYTPNGVTRDDAYIADGNANVAVVKMGTIREDALTYPINALYAKALRGGTAGTGTSLITLV